jgi:hypothetical protein
MLMLLLLSIMLISQSVVYKAMRICNLLSEMKLSKRRLKSSLASKLRQRSLKCFLIINLK